MTDNQSIRPNHRPDHASVEPETADTHELSLTDAEHHALKETLASSPLAVLLDAAGHNEACIRRIRSGRSLSCSCQTTPQPLDDAATAIGLAIRFAQMGAERQVPIPRGVIQALVRQVDARNPAAILVWHWLARRGQVPARAGVRPELRLVCERS
jgi:hypothetical protein